jgi:4-aminobutyrate aminotransferase-like enzyme/Ser/Thr protein kinase RdoA (MazF antagonist)
VVAISHRVPAFDLDAAVRLAHDLYGLDVAAHPLPGEHDRNFRLLANNGAQYVLRIAHADEDPALLDLQIQALDRIAARAPDLAVQRVVPTIHGEPVTRVVASDGSQHLVRLMTFLPGRLLADSRPHTPDVLEALGRTLATIDRALLDLEHPAADRVLKWDLLQAGWASGYLESVADLRRRAKVRHVLGHFEKRLLPQLTTLRRSIIHNDANDYNVLVAQGGPGGPGVAVIDFGDMLRTATVAEVAIACAYVMLDKPDPLAAAADVVRGYHSILPLEARELAVLFDLIRTRLAVSVINSSHQQTIDPENTYLQISSRPAWALLKKLESVVPAWAEAAFRHACGMEPWPQAARVAEWLAANSASFAPVVTPDPRSAPVYVLDLSIGSHEIGGMAEIADAHAVDAAINAQLRQARAAIGVGRYDEARLIYRAPMFRAESNSGPEWRTIHIGLDLFQPAYAPVFAPLAGVVHAARDNAGALDYGPTIILRHEPEGAPPFYTLYGHLSRASLADLQVGQPIAAGQQIATTGDFDVNGGWPPHLHFQVIGDMLGRDGEFPGVARPGERALWLALCPDPNLIVGVPSAAFPALEPAVPTLLEERRERIGYNLSISYRRPLHIVRGFMQHLYDVEGRAFLDSVNNVPHVGHQHPHVVRAGQRQMAVLNTNTRYLHGELLRYAERLTATLPDPLSVCFFVCSGSEATELALRLARAHTGQRDLIVSDGAYHGNTNTLIEISPYKSEGPGGNGLAPWAHKAPMPDVYRGLYKADDAEAGRKYAQLIQPLIDRIQAEGRGLSGFIIESLLSCGGQIVLPPGYLAEAYRLVRAAGGVCIADEVQVGFGRVGSRFWGFETQGVVPDIVAMGKPIGNGHPLGAVVTTPAIAASFNNGMEYFNTFGGNPVSVAIGQAVLDVIAEERLQQRALRVGGRMLAGLQGLVGRHALVGDARGLGLMLGVELVRDRVTLEPADWEASYIANRMRDHGILLSTDGPLHNVLKIKPPLVYTEQDADRLVETLDIILGEDVLQR